MHPMMQLFCIISVYGHLELSQNGCPYEGFSSILGPSSRYILDPCQYILELQNTPRLSIVF